MTIDTFMPDQTTATAETKSNVEPSTFNTDIAISVRNVSKMYPLYDDPRDRLKQSLWYALPGFLRGQPRQFFREFWALRDISFEVKKGETLGIIGRNGSGKSTILQIIAGTLTPTTGEVQVNGRVAALLELGSGFNSEFTGRENVYLNGSILGFSQEEMDKRFDEIAAFADIGQFIDQPVKLYSSGMFVRLAFAVQVLLDPDILVVDEALAVGDAAFTMKCMSRMKRLAESGVTILLVSHDVQSVRSFCNKAIWLEQGEIRSSGTPLEITSQYVQFLFGNQTGEKVRTKKPQPDFPVMKDETQSGEAQEIYSEHPLISLNNRSDLVRWGSGELVVEAVAIDNCLIDDSQSIQTPVFEHGERLHIEFQVRAIRDIPSTEVGFGFGIRNNKGLDIITSTTYEEGCRIRPFRAGEILRVTFEVKNILAPNDYALVVSVEDRTGGQIHYYDYIENTIIFKVISKKYIYSLVLPPVIQKITSRRDNDQERG
jgi:ABC-type polysaccharide/polyol phosphate transport system ATPase subunit